MPRAFICAVLALGGRRRTRVRKSALARLAVQADQPSQSEQRNERTLLRGEAAAEEERDGEPRAPAGEEQPTYGQPWPDVMGHAAGASGRMPWAAPGPCRGRHGPIVMGHAVGASGPMSWAAPGPYRGSQASDAMGHASLLAAERPTVLVAARPPVARSRGGAALQRRASLTLWALEVLSTPPRRMCMLSEPRPIQAALRLPRSDF
ncbi:unnamed protein product [Prorocentrum cordatum]|uniref:Uncharacterized protein n=1 Tax=Prorocentrum cordatum TaxID=2364126 RepID=A0ABN9X9B7_9DINO|nr:unnamed protein product [Polarella glacialis]